MDFPLNEPPPSQPASYNQALKRNMENKQINIKNSVLFRFNQKLNIGGVWKFMQEMVSCFSLCDNCLTSKRDYELVNNPFNDNPVSRRQRQKLFLFLKEHTKVKLIKE